MVYVDDVTITANRDGSVQPFIKLLAQRFSLKDLGPLNYFLGIEVIPHAYRVLLSQRCYILDLLARTHISDSKPVATPLALVLSLHSSSGAI